MALIEFSRWNVKCSGRELRGLARAVLIVAAVAAGTGCAKPKQAGFAMPPTPVETAVAQSGVVKDQFEAVGTVAAMQAITVMSEIDGPVVALPFKEGAPVAKGGLIALLDDTQLKAELERAQAQYDQSKLTYDRVKSVVDQSAGSPEDLDNAAATLKVAQANLDVARSRFSKTRITAPFSGTLGSRQVSVGAFVRAGTAITDLAQLDEIRVGFSAPERYLEHLHPGAEVDVYSPAIPNLTLKGRVEVVEPVVDASTRSAKLWARVPNPGQHFRPGMSANVSATLGERMQAVTIPSEAIFVEGDQTLVYVINGDSVAPRPLTLGTRMTENVEVLKGLAAGEKVVRTGHQKLYPGAKVLDVAAMAAGGPPGAGAAADPKAKKPGSK